MKFLDVGQEATGFIAIGQIATGVIAIGQVATGVIAIGQVARGVVAVGMGAFGLVSVGMLSGGVIHATGMLGLSGLPGKGFVLPLMPFPRVPAFEVKKPEELFRARVAGFVRAKLTMGADRVPHLVTDQGEFPEPVVVALELTDAARTRAADAEGERAVIAYLEPPAAGAAGVAGHRAPWTAERLVALPAMATSLGPKLVVWAFGLSMIVGLSAAFYEFVAIPVLESVLAGG